jgi:L-lactate dehydrogenase complex protein LldG
MVEGPQMSEREQILARIREGLAQPAPIPGHARSLPSAAGLGRIPIQGAQRWLPLVGESFGERLALFRKTAADLKADFRLLENQGEMGKTLGELRSAEGWNRIGVHGGALVSKVCEGLDSPVCRTDGPYNIQELERCDAGITECDALVAQTGSVLVTSRSAGGRALSVLAPHHVVLARREQLVRDLPEAFSLLKDRYAPNYPSFISFITGPSRTGDIERILVLGAHGPKKLTILCC